MTSVFFEVVALLYVNANYLRFALRSSLCASLRFSLNASLFAIAINSNGFASVMCCSFARRPLFAFPTSLFFVRAKVTLRSFINLPCMLLSNLITSQFYILLPVRY